MDTNTTLAHLGVEIAELRSRMVDAEYRTASLSEENHLLHHNLDAERTKVIYMCEVVARILDRPEIPEPEDFDPYNGEFARPNGGDPLQKIGGVWHRLPAYTGYKGGTDDDLLAMDNKALQERVRALEDVVVALGSDLQKATADVKELDQG